MVQPTGVERFFEDDEMIVSKTDVKGRVTYGNDVFLRLAGYKEKEIVGQPHSIIRHPDMPRCVFKLLWDTLSMQKEIFAYVVNLSKNGDHYWVFAHVSPTYNTLGEVVGYHSTRRVPNRQAIAVIEPLYKKLIGIEKSFRNRREGMKASTEALHAILKEAGVSYDKFVLSLQA